MKMYISRLTAIVITKFNQGDLYIKSCKCENDNTQFINCYAAFVNKH